MPFARSSADRIHVRPTYTAVDEAASVTALPRRKVIVTDKLNP